MKRGLFLLLLVFVLALLPANALANLAPFWPDGFLVGTDAAAFFKIDGPGVRAVAVQPWDGKIVIGGDFSITTGTPQKTWKYLARINTDGSLDQSFTATPDGPVNAIAIVKEANAPQQQDYKPIPQLNESRIYIGGSFSHVALSMDPAATQQARQGIARLRCSDGSLDAFAPLPAGAVINAIVADPDGNSILVGGIFSGTVTTAGGSASYRNIARISVVAPGDEPVTGTFSGGTDGEVNAILLQEALVVIGGKASTAGKYLLRFGADGTPDSTFAAATDGAVRALALEADGRILVGGDFATVNGVARSYLARLKMDGTLDPAFNGALENPGAGAGYYVAAIAVQPDGKIVAGGKFGKSGGVARSNALRLKRDGAVDEKMDPGTDGDVRALAVEPNGRFLMAGEFASAAGKSRTRLARFYCNGALDDVIPDYASDEEFLYWIYNGSPHSAGLHPDGSLTFTGELARGMHRLKPDFSLDVEHESWWVVDGNGGGPIHQAQSVEDDSIVAVGRFTSLVSPPSVLDPPSGDGVTTPAYGVMRYGADLQPIPDFPHYFDSLYTSLPLLDVALKEGPWAVAALPPHSKMSVPTTVDGTPYPKGTELEGGMVYVGGGWTPTAAGKPARLYLVRLKANGDVDTSFNAPALDGYVTAIYIQSDDRIIVAGLFPGSDGYSGGLKRLETNGDLDPTFKAPEFRIGNNVSGIKYVEMDTIVMAKDGKSMLVGGFFERLKDQDGMYERSTQVRLNKTERVLGDGSLEERWVVDPVYNVGNSYVDEAYGLESAERMAPQTDGNMYVMGIFSAITPAGGETFAQLQTVRVDHDGKIFTDPVPREGDSGDVMNHLTSILQLPDGKLVFTEMYMGTFGAITRFSNGWATEELSASPAGDAVTWMRAGTSPEVWGVYFEEAANENGPWNYLGRGRSIPGGWTLDGLVLPKLENRYIRARAYTEGHSWEPTASVIESVRLYYLKHPLLVTAADSGKVYGGADPALSYSATGFLPGDSKASALTGNVARSPGKNVGSYPITQGTLSGGDKYRITYSGANFAITPATLAVVAKPASKTTVQTDPVFDFTATGYQAGDDQTVFSGTLDREPAGNTAGTYQVNQGTLSAAPNYDIAFTGAPFTITEGVRAAQTITFTGRRFWTYGDADFDPGATATSGLTVSYTTSDPSVLAVVDGKLKVVGVGTADITASQDGNFAFLPAASITRTYTVSDPPGMSLKFDGIDDYVRIENAQQLNFGTKSGFTLEMWVGPYGSQPDGTVLLNKKDGGSPLTGYQLSINDNKLSALIGDGSTAVSLTATSPLDDWVWHHVALTVDRIAGVGRLYFDGRVEVELTDPRLKGNPDNTEPILLGRDRDGSHSYNGDIDELRLWSVARTQEQIRDYASNIIDPADELTLAAYYHFDEGGEENPNKTIVPDRTLRGADGLAHNFAGVGIDSNWQGSSAFTPLLETLPLTSATSTSATGNALMYPNYYEPDDYVICWGTELYPAYKFFLGEGGRCMSPSEAGNPFSVVIDSLVPGSTYHVQAYAINNMGKAFGNDVLLVPKLDQVLSFADMHKVYGDPPFLPGATSTGPGPITYASSNTAVAKIVDGKIQVVGAGTSIITASQAADATHYAAADVTAQLTVDPAILYVTANAKSKLYGAADPALDCAPPVGLVNGDNATVLTGNLVRAGGDNVGSYAIGKGSLSAGANYTISFTGANLTIDPAPLTVAANAKSKTYGAPDPVLDCAPPVGLVNGDNAAVLICNLVRAAGDNVGSYAIGKGIVSAGANYTVSFTGANLTIDPAPLAVAANAKSKIYGAPDPVLDCAPPVGLVNGDNAAVLTGNLVRAAGENVGSYAIGQGSLNAGSNYTISFTGANLTIDQATLTVTANAKSKIYGSADPVLDYAPPVGLVRGDNATVLTGNLVRVAGENVGSYAIGQGSLSAGSNYTITFTGAKLTIDPATLAVTANAKSKTYGSADPVLDYAAPVGLVRGDNATILTGNLARVAGENVGSYAIGQGSLSAGSNYTISFTGADLTIDPATLAVTAHAKSKRSGTIDPALDYAVTGFMRGETIAILTGSLSRAAGETAGVYPITIGTLSAGANYTIAFTGASLTITTTSGPVPQVITFNPMRPKTYGDGDFDPGATASSGLPVSYASSYPGIGAVVGGKIRVLAPGSTDITASQGGNEFYLPAADVTRTLIVNPPPWNGVGFDGIDDVLRIPDGPQLSFGSKPGYTVETWLHLDGPQPDGTGLVSKGGSGSAWSGYQLIFSQDRIAAEIADGSRSLTITGTSGLNDGQWHHVALSVARASGTASLYMDGRLEAQVTDPVLKGSPDSTAAVLAGVNRDGVHFYKGQMDELRLWDTPRSREEIRSAVSQIIDPLNEPHLVAYFHLDEGDVGQDNSLFTVAPERTAYGANAALQGFALGGADSNWIRSGAFLPLLETAPLTLTSGGGATGGGLVYPNYYEATDVGLCWGTSARPGLADSCVHAGSGPGAFTAAISGLLPGMTYHVRAFAINTMGTAYGNEIILETGKVTQTITLPAIPDKTYGDPPFPPGGTSTGPGPITYTSSDPSVAIIDNDEIKITGVGTTTITASQAGDETHSTAPDVSVPFTVHPAPLTVTADWKSRAYQTPNPPLTASYRGFVYGETMAVISGAPVLSTTAALSSPVGQYPISVALGSLSARNYYFILVDGVLNVLKSCQEIVFPPIQDRTYGDPPIQVIASACSGLAITFTSSDTQVAQVNGSVLTVTGAGSVVITASQSGSDSVGGAPDVSQTVIVHKAGQALTFPVIAQKTLGEAPFDPAATSSSGLPVSYQSSDPAVAVASGNMVTIVGAGTTVITAIQQGSANYNPAIPASQPLNVVIEATSPVIELSTLSPGSATADPVLNVTGSAKDASGIAALTVNGVDFTGRENLFSSAVLLAAGQNIVEVIARDRAGNRSTRTVSVAFDAAAPAITASAPADNSVTGAGLFTVSGTVTAGSAVTISVNGAVQQSLAVTGGEYAGSGYLSEGVNTLEISAALYGRTSTIKRTVTLSPGRPSVAISEPVEDIRTEQERVTLRGKVAVPEGEAKLVLDVNGTCITPVLQAGAFQQEVVLAGSGTTSITATVSDSSGNTAVSHRNIIRVAPLPGDLNGDGLVDIRDVMQALRISTGLDIATPVTLAHGDLAPLVDGVPRPDGSLDVGDVMVLLRKVIGLVDF